VLDVTLFALKIAFLVLLYLFVFLVVRRAARDVTDERAPAPARATPAPTPLPVPAAAPEASPAERRQRREQRLADRTMPGESFDLMAHIDPRLVVESSPVVAPGTVVRLEGWIMIGRSPTSDLVLDDPYVSQTHARVVPRGQLHFVEDLGSTNGTFVNGREVLEAQLLLDTELRIGETIFRYEE
jgi:hypothetical protein